MSQYKAFVAPKAVLEDRMPSELCPGFVDGLCDGGEQCDYPEHVVYLNTLVEDLENDKPQLQSRQPNTIDAETSLKITQEPYEDLAAGTNCRDGIRHDNDHTTIKDIQLLPTTDEILSLKAPYLPPNHKSACNFSQHGYERYLDMNFRYLRQDNIAEICDAVRDASQRAIACSHSAQFRYETVNGTRYNLFSSVEVFDLAFDDKVGTHAQLSYQCPEELKEKSMSTANILDKGKLVCLLSIHEQTKEINTTFCIVRLLQSTWAMKSVTGDHSLASVRISLAEPKDIKKVRQLAQYQQNLYNNVKHYLVDLTSSVLPAGFMGHLERLQKLSIQPHFAFKETLATTNRLDQLIPNHPQFSENFTYNLKSLRASSSDTEDFTMEPHNIDGAFQSGRDMSMINQLEERTNLDEGQAIAVYEALNRDYALLQGPPGCGKSFLGNKLVQIVIDSREQDEKAPVLVVCQTNHALDDFLEGVLDTGNDRIIRVGSRSSSTKVTPHTLSNKRSNTKRSCKDNHTVGRALAQIRGLYKQGMEMAESFNGDNANIKWTAVHDHLASQERTTFKHFLKIESIVPKSGDLGKNRRGGFAFNFWLGGGNFENLKPAQSELVNESKIWVLSLEARRKLASTWALASNPWKFCDAFAEVHRRLMVALDASSLAKSESDSSAISTLKTDIVGVTSTGFVNNYELIKSLRPRTIVFEEASELLEAHTICCMIPTLKHCISIGDPKQLRPSVNEKLLSKDNSPKYRHDESVFERLMEHERMPYSRLITQRRAHPEMADLIRAGDYNFVKDHPSTLNRPMISGLTQRVFWVDHTHQEEKPDPESVLAKSPSNQFEVDYISGLAKYLVESQGYQYRDLTILTPYNGQIAAFQRKLAGTCNVALTEADKTAMINAGLLEEEDRQRGTPKMNVPVSSMLRIATVDNYQGEQARVVIFSPVRSNSRNTAGFLKNHNRINVAISRAQESFFVVGNSQLMSTIPEWKRVIEVFKTKKALGPSLHASCPRHPDESYPIHHPGDFEKVPRCKVICNHEFACGHRCTATCHSPRMHLDGRMPCSTTDCSTRTPKITKTVVVEQWSSGDSVEEVGTAQWAPVDVEETGIAQCTTVEVEATSKARWITVDVEETGIAQWTTEEWICGDSAEAVGIAQWTPVDDIH